MTDVHVFPQPDNFTHGEQALSYAGGISKRELFAAMCLQGMYAGGANIFQKDLASIAKRRAEDLLAELAGKKARDEPV